MDETKILNAAYKEAMNEYRQDISKLEDIKKRNQSGEPITKEEIDWLCSTLSYRTSQVESSWYSH